MKITFDPHSHCHFCGNPFNKKFATEPGLEIQCTACKQFTYKNPIPVAVLLIPTPNRQHLFLVQRGIDPGKGKYACPGGFMLEGESWREAAAREVREELNIHIHEPESTIALVDVLGAPPWKRTLIFGIVTRQSAIEVRPFTKSEEALERAIVGSTSRFPIAFSLHQQMIERFLNNELVSLLEHPDR
jgi:ADP-ribose pyrophosphatase YjhB (NUDIX family)